MLHANRWWIAAAMLLFLAGACSASGDPSDGALDDDTSSGQGGATGSGGSGGDVNFTTTSGVGGGVLMIEPPCEDSDPTLDQDGDGFTDDQGDCNDCTELMNPGALDYPGNNIDDDCNGTEDDNPTDCDGPLALQSTNGLDAARAMGLCKMSQFPAWGVVSAQYLRGDGTPGADPIGHGILTGFGPNVSPQEGTKLFAISSGTARQPTDPGYEDPAGHDKMYTSGAPAGYPKEFAGCPDVMTGEPHDSISLRLEIKTPTNAKSFAFNVNMYTWEFPDYICSEFNDFLVAMLSPVPQGQADGNISFDSQGNPLSVNAGFLEVCKPTFAGGKDFPCMLGPAQLTGTGFEGHAATGWLQTTAPVVAPGSNITIDFAVWDSGDGVLDTTGLFDNFRFEVEETPTVTKPVEDPK
jgi:hypothetical protein